MHFLFPFTSISLGLLFLPNVIANHPLSKSSSTRNVRAAFGSPSIDRRTALLSGIASSLFSPSVASAALKPNDAAAASSKISYETSPYYAYGVIPDASNTLNPSLQTVSNKDFLNKFTAKNMKGGALWLGEHHNSATDHNLQADLIRSLYERRCKSSGSSSLSSSTSALAIGLEQVQIQFQPVLDDFVNGVISEEEMLKGVDWEQRWFWSYDKYRPVFELAREKKIPLIALNVNSEDLAVVERSGYPGLSPSQLQRYIKDRAAFAKFISSEAFKTYVSYVITPSYEIHRQMGLLQRTISGEVLEQEMPFRNFFSGRILWDESMASMAYGWTASNPGGLLVGLVGADHVKFDKGIPGRYARMAGTNYDNVSVMLNPTLIDTRPPGSVSNIIGADSAQYPDKITLQLRYLKEGVDYNSPEARSPEYTGGVLPLADYILVSAKESRLDALME